MTSPTSPASPDPIQFDRAVSKDGAEKTPGVTCSMCGHKIVDRYWTLGDQPTCVSCKAAVQRDAAAAKRPGVFIKSASFGFGAAIAGAILYYAVLKMLNLEIGLVAIACGYMVGLAMRKGAQGWGGKRFQLAAAGLTYFSVAMAYLPIAMEGSNKAAANTAKLIADSLAVLAAADSAAADSARALDLSSSVVNLPTAVLAGDPVTMDSIAADSAATADSDSTTTDSTATDSTASTTAGTDDETPGAGMAILGLGFVFAFSLALPILVIIGSMPGGLISALIIGFGMHQAWKMTAAPDLEFHGPLTVAK